jgi:hypothetical protein
VSVPAASLPAVVKLDVGAWMRCSRTPAERRGYIRAMPTFTLAGVEYEYLAPKLEGDPEEIHSWEYGQWPRVEAAVPLKDGGTVSVYGEAMRWGHEQIIVRWLDDEEHAHAHGSPKITSADSPRQSGTSSPTTSARPNCGPSNGASGCRASCPNRAVARSFPQTGAGHQPSP